MDASVLLLWLGTEACPSADEKQPEKPHQRYEDESQERRAWEKWNEALVGLKRNARTLRRVSGQMKTYLAEAENWLPGESGCSMRHSRVEVYKVLNQVIPSSARVLGGFVDKIEEYATALEAYCILGKKWREVAGHSTEIEIQRTINLLISARQLCRGESCGRAWPVTARESKSSRKRFRL
jgi:hypothetical protein